MTIDVNAVNDAPTAADQTVTTDEDTAYAFGASDFGYTDGVGARSLVGGNAAIWSAENPAL